jgi:hypothetical protein
MSAEESPVVVAEGTFFFDFFFFLFLLSALVSRKQGSFTRRSYLTVHSSP